MNHLLRHSPLWLALGLGLMAFLTAACGVAPALGGVEVAPPALPTLAVAAAVPSRTPTPEMPPATWTAVPTDDAAYAANSLQAALAATFTPRPTQPATGTPLPIPTRTPVTPTLTPSITLTPSQTPTPTAAPFNQYGLDEVLPINAFPRPLNDNGWGMHWMPTTSQSPADIDRFIAELKKMHIKWVVFLNENSSIGSNDYLVEQLVANSIMPIMRIYRPDLLPYDGELGPMVAHYRRKGVIYFQLYNEPNVNIENNQGFANPNVYAVTWAAAARDVINNGGLPGIGAFSPGGEYNHLLFFQRTLRALKYNGDAHLLNRAWIAIHNYHGTRPLDDLGGFLMFREYDRIAREELGRSLPIIGTEGGSYSENPQVVVDLVRFQYTYMRDAEPYYFAVTYWLLANRAGGGGDDQWEWQALFRPGYTHPVVTDFFYRNSR